LPQKTKKQKIAEFDYQLDLAHYQLVIAGALALSLFLLGKNDSTTAVIVAFAGLYFAWEYRKRFFEYKQQLLD